MTQKNVDIEVLDIFIPPPTSANLDCHPMPLPPEPPIQVLLLERTQKQNSMIIEGTIRRPLVHQVPEVIPPREVERGCYTAPAALYQIPHSLHQRQIFTEPYLMKNGNV